MEVLRLDHVTKRFGKHVAVNDVSAAVPGGCIYGVIGPNGAGKTTTLRMILNIFAPDEGTIRIFGEPHSEALKDRIGYLPEERGLYKKMKVVEVLLFFARLKGMSRPRALVEIARWLDRFDLGKWAKARTEALSKGMQQKVQFLATILPGPDLIVLDEPFSGLDPVNTNLMKDVLLELKREGKTILFSTHGMEVAEKVCDAVLMISRGKKVLDGPLEELLRSHGGDSIVLEYDGDGAALRGIEGIDRVNDYGKYVDVTLVPGFDPQRLLGALVGRVEVRRFETRRSSLTDIFLRLAGKDE